MWPRRLAIKAHAYCSEASLSLRRINQNQESIDQKIRQKMAVVDCLYGNIHAVTALFMMSWEMVGEQAKIWGVDLFYVHRKIKHTRLEDIDGAKLKNMPEDLKQAVKMAKAMLSQATTPATKEKECKKCKAQNNKLTKVSAIFKVREELDMVIMPAARYYAKKNLSPLEAGFLNEEET